jgi:GST-like protein
MTHWRSGKDWFKTECPRLFSVAAGVERLPVLNPLFREHFG